MLLWAKNAGLGQAHPQKTAGSQSVKRFENLEKFLVVRSLAEEIDH